MKFIKILHKQSNVIQIIKYSKLLEEIMIRDIIINNDNINNNNNLSNVFLLTQYRNVIPKYLELKKASKRKKNDEKIPEVDENSLCNKIGNSYEVNECPDEQNHILLEPDDMKLSNEFINNCHDQINVPQFNSIAKDFTLINESTNESTNETIEIPYYSNVKCNSYDVIENVDAFSNINMFNSHKRSGNGAL